MPAWPERWAALQAIGRELAERPQGRAIGIAIGAVVTGCVVWVALRTVVRPSLADIKSPPPRTAPFLVYPEGRVPVASFERGAPPDVVSTANRIRPSWNLGMRLERTEIGATWSDHRAVIDVSGEPGVRAYAIGDLLPYGAVLVGVSTGAVQLMVADSELVYLNDRGKIRSVQDFRAAYEPAALRATRENKAFRAALLEVLAFLRSDDPQEVQGAIDAVIASGSAAVGPIIPFVESALPVATSTATYVFAGAEPRQPAVYGDLVVGILQAITGQSFGDPMADGLTSEERMNIRAQWTRWWAQGLPE